MIQDLSGLFVNEFVRSKYACIDVRVFCFLLSRERKNFVVNPERGSAVDRFDGLAGAKHVSIDSHSQLGCELVEKRGR